ncbi:uncharacterized protein LOC124163026 [Ischnura elegans]|uniref:uncharacterized protein LOC124163026 n=1 Tax=Ischnura elegans TaxID=197161 RepID=UPI001ED89E16|nr:uncharacterized protein LOC124163026 [Ischnura elegans]
MSTNQEIFNQFNSGFFHSIEELIQAHNDIHNNVIFNNDSIDDKITYQNMKNLIDNFKNRQYCRTCEEYYCLSDELPHDNTTNHIHNLTQSLNNEEILNYFQAGVYNTEEEIEFALTRINERIIFENDVINDLETFRNLKARLDILKGRRYCTYCETFYSIDEAMPHENTNEHRHYVTVQLGRGFNQIQSAIRSRLKTFWITPEQNSSIDVISFLNDIKQKLFEKLNEGVIENNSIKFNLVLICKFRKNEKEELDTAFKTPNTRVLLIDMIDEIIDEAFSKILKEKSEFQAKGSGWSLSEVIGLELRINKYNPLRGSTYIELPAKIKNTKSVVNVKNNDRYCFKYAIWSKNIIDHPNLVWNYNNNEFRNAYNWDCIKYPVDPKDIIKFERMNNISINLFGLDEKNNVYPMKIVDEELDDHRDLLYITNDKTGHYCWVKNFNKLIKSQITKHHHSISICKRCFIHFRDMTKFMEHKALCKGTGVPSKVIMPDEENKILKFTNLNRFFRIPYVIYADFECLLKDVSTCNPSPKESFTNVIQTHEPFSFCYMLVTPDGCQKPILYRGPYAARVFINRIKDEAVKIYEIYKNTIPINPLTEEEESIFLTSVNCHICEKELGGVTELAAVDVDSNRLFWGSFKKHGKLVAGGKKLRFADPLQRDETSFNEGFISHVELSSTLEALTEGAMALYAYTEAEFVMQTSETSGPSPVKRKRPVEQPISASFHDFKNLVLQTVYYLNSGKTKSVCIGYDPSSDFESVVQFNQKLSVGRDKVRHFLATKLAKNITDCDFERLELEMALITYGLADE